MLRLTILLVLGLVTNIHGARTATPTNVNTNKTLASDISIETAPYVVSVQVATDNGNQHKCGGSIIHEKFIVTAARCIEPGTTYKVLVGTDNLNQGGQLHDVEKVIVHEKYKNTTKVYDAALLVLKTPLEFSSKVNKIPYEAVHTPSQQVYSNDEIIFQVTGWAYNQANETVPERLQRVAIPRILNFKCKQARLRHRLGGVLTTQHICAGSGNVDSCSKDSGGPLTDENGVLLGITSYGSCESRYGVYTRISSVKTWINASIEENK